MTSAYSTLYSSEIDVSEGERTKFDRFVDPNV